MNEWDWPLILQSITVVAITITAIFAIRTYYKAKSNEDKTDGKWQGEVNSDRKIFKEFMKEIKEKWDNIDKKLWKIAEDIAVLKTQQQITKTNSPISLTELGQKVSKEIDAKIFAKEEAKKIVDQLPSKSPYTIQEFAFEYVKNLEPDDELLLKLENSAFINGITLPMAKEALAVELRDALLKEVNI